jgi:hypothetical protein
MNAGVKIQNKLKEWQMAAKSLKRRKFRRGLGLSEKGDIW